MEVNPTEDVKATESQLNINTNTLTVRFNATYNQSMINFDLN